MSADHTDTDGSAMARRDRWAIALLTAGGVVVPVLGWVFGALLLWTSDRWPVRRKLLGTLVVPGGLLPAVLLASGAVGGYHTLCSSNLDGSSETCTAGPGTGTHVLAWIALIALVALPIATAVALSRRPRASRASLAQVVC